MADSGQQLLELAEGGGEVDGADMADILILPQKWQDGQMSVKVCLSQVELMVDGL